MPRQRKLVLLGSALVAGLAVGSVGVALADSSGSKAVTPPGSIHILSDGGAQVDLPGATVSVPPLKSVALTGTGLVTLNAAGQALVASDPNAVGYINTADWLQGETTTRSTSATTAESTMPVLEADGATVIGTIVVGTEAESGGN